MTPSGPRRPIKQVEREIGVYRPIRSLFLLDVLRDHDSWPVLGWALSTLLLGTLVYHWLEGWSYLDARYFCVISLATIGYGGFTPTTPLARAFTNRLRHQRHRYPAGAVRPYPRGANTTPRERQVIHDR